MLRGLRLYFLLIGASVKVQLADRRSALYQIVGQVAITGIEFLALMGLFSRFGGFAGWSLAEVAFLYGVVDVVFAFADALSYGFDSFSQLVRAGEVDRLLLRPVSPILQLMGRELTVKRAGRLVQGAVVLGWAAARLGEPSSGLDLLLLVLAAAAGVVCFVSLFLMQAALSFVTVDGLEVVNCFTYGGRQTLARPLSGYRAPLRAIFLFLVPVGSVLYLPVAAVLGKEALPGLPAWSAWPALLAAPAFAGLAYGAWRLGLRKHASTGS